MSTPDQRSLHDQILSLRRLGIDAGLYDAVDFLVNTDNHVRCRQELANHFADILAASAYDLLSKKSTGKSERQRQISICKKAISGLRSGSLEGSRVSPAENVLLRLEKILKEFDTCV